MWECGGLVQRTTVILEMRPDQILKALVYHTKDSRVVNAGGDSLETFK